MRTATHLVILASLAFLELGANPSDLSEEEKEKMMASLPIECCELDKALPSIFTADPEACAGGSILKQVVDSKKDNKAKDQEENCVVECILGEHALLNADKSIKNEELKTLFLKNVYPDAKGVMTAALNECFEDHDGESHKDDNCKSGAEELLSCIMSEVFSNCPKTMWKAENEQCKGYKITVDTVADAI